MAVNNRLVKWFQDYHDGLSFPGRGLFGFAARVASAGYRLGYIAHRMSATIFRRGVRLRGTVIAIGSVMVGGSGKTAVTDYLASQLAAAGRAVAVLTRGYQRATRRRQIIEPGTVNEAAVEKVGDEPWMLARRNPRATIIIDHRRAAAAVEFERQHRPDVFLLDDGYQYAGLEIDCRILCLSVGDLGLPGRLVPAGRWREPRTAVRRADGAVFILPSGDDVPDVDRDALRRLGQQGSVFAFQYVLNAWRELGGGRVDFSLERDSVQPGAFCGLARPAAFLEWLEGHGIVPRWVERFPDHFRYRQQDLDRLAARAQSTGAECLITTEKDAVKLARLSARNVRIVYPEVRLEPRGDKGAFKRWIDDVISRR